MKMNTYPVSAVVPYLLMGTLAISCLTYSAGGGLFIDVNKLNFSMVAIGGTCMVIPFFFLLKSRSGIKLFVWNRVDFTISLWFIFITVISWITKRHLDRERYLLFVIGIMFYYCCRLTISNDRKKVLSAFLICTGILTAIESIIVILQVTGVIPTLNEFFTITGTFKNPAPLALFLSSCLPFIYYSFCVVRKAWLKTFFALALILSLFAVCISGNRASYFALIVIAAVYLVSRYKTFFNLRQNRVSKIIAFVAGLAVVLVVACYLYRLKPVSADGRLFIWTVSYPQILERPILGGGIGSFKENYSIWQAMYFSSHPDSRLLSDTSISNIAGYVRLAYNEYLEILLEQGFLGLILFLSIFYCSFRFAIPASVKHHRSVSIPIIASLSAILAQSLISYPLHSLPGVILVFLLLAFLNNETQMIFLQKNLVTQLRKPNMIIFLLPLAGLLTLFSGIKRLENYHSYLFARNLFNHDKSSSMIIFDSLSDRLSTDPNFLIDYSICLASNNQYIAAVNNLNKASKLDGDPQIYILLGDFYTRLKNYEFAEKSYRLAYLIVPSLIYPRYALVKLLIIRGKIDEAKIVAKAILTLRVKLSNERSDRMIKEMRSFLDNP